MTGESPSSESGFGANSPDLGSLLLTLGKFLAQHQPAPRTESSSGPALGTTQETEDALPTMEARYRVLVEQIPAVVFMAFVEGGMGEAYVSPQIERVLGFSREEWLDDPIRWYQQIHPEDRDRWSIEAAAMFATGSPLKSIYRVVARDGRVVWFHCEAKLVSHKNGQPWFIHGVGFDVTELKRTEQALQEASAERERLQKIALDRQIAKTEQMESQLSAIVESSEDAIIGTDLDGAITSWNAAATGVFGYQPEEVLGKSVLMLIPPELHDEEMENLGKLRRGVRIEHQETQRIAKVGARLDVSLTISPIKDQDGRVIGGSKIVRDITERKRSEEKLRITEKLAATGRLAATIAHEVNNPLEAVTNLLYLARTNFGMSAEARRYLETADEELARIAHLTKQTLGFYRDGSSPSQFNVADAIESVLAIYSQRAANRDVQFEKQLDPSIRVLAYPGEFRQVISNLLVNAIDAMTGRGGRLVIRARRSANHNKVRISVADTGAGIPAASKKKIFEAFYTTKAEVGTGLGLWLSRTLVEKHGGSIRVRSRTDSPQGGTVFSIFWPIEPVQKMSEPS